MRRLSTSPAGRVVRQPEATWKPDLVAALNKLTGDIGDIEIKRAAGYLVVRFRRTIGP